MYHQLNGLRSEMVKIYSEAQVCGRPGDSDPNKCYQLEPGEWHAISGFTHYFVMYFPTLSKHISKLIVYFIDDYKMSFSIFIKMYKKSKNKSSMKITTLHSTIFSEIYFCIIGKIMGKMYKRKFFVELTISLQYIYWSNNKLMIANT